MILALWLALFGLWSVPSSEGPPPVPQPKEYTSPSGDFVLEVDPSRRLGAGAGTYRMSRGGTQIWEVTQPFTLWDARVRDDGWTVGYAYTEGWRDIGVEGDFRVVSLSPLGKVVLDHSTERTSSHYLHSPPDPVARGLFLDPGSDRFVVRVADPDHNRRIEEWWTYSASGVERESLVRPEGHEMPEDKFSRRIQDVRWLPGLALRLVWWWHVDFADRSAGYFSEGGEFALVDESGKEVWSLPLLRDYTVEDDEQADDALRERVERLGALLEVKSSGRFSIWKVQDRTRLELVVEPGADGSGWEVTPIQETDFDPPDVNEASAAEPPPVETIELEFLESASLGDATTSNEDEILEFDFAANGDFRVLRRADEEQRIYRLEIMDRQGGPVREVEFAALPAQLKRAAWWPLKEGRWLVTGSEYGDVVPTAFFASERDGELTPVRSAFPFAVKSVAPTPEGGFVALVVFRFQYTSVDALYSFDRKGELLWEIAQDYEDAEALFSPEDLAVTPAGQVAVVDNIRNNVQLFDLEGNYVRTLDLETILPQEPNYPSGLTQDPSGSLLLHDFDAEFPLHRIDGQGQVTMSMRIVPLDGRPLGRLHDRTKAAPNGELWTTDGDVLLRFAEDGTIAETLGDLPDLERLNDPGPTHIDALGRILIQDEVTGVLHAFDATGRRLFTAHPEAGDFDDQALEKIVVDRGGSVYVQSDLDRKRLVQFSRDGARLGWSDLGSRTVAFGPDGSRWLGFGSWDFVGARLVKGEQTTAQVQRTADGLWFGSLSALAVDFAGKLAVLHSPAWGSAAWGSAGGSGLSFYDAQGTPTGRAAVGGYHLALCDSWAVTWRWSSAANLVRRSDNKVFRFLIDDAKEGQSFDFGFSPDGKELWAVGGEGPTLRRFALP